MISSLQTALAEAPDSADPAAAEERQTSPRSTLWINGRLSAGERTIDCDILNASAGGVRVRLAPGSQSDPVMTLAFDGQGAIGVRLAWRHDDLAGLRFEGPATEIARFLESLEAAKPSIMEQRRHRRCSVMWSACVFSGGRSMQAMVLNLSAGGARVRLSGGAILDDRATLSIERFGDFPGRLAWRNGNDLGLEFLDPPDRIVTKLGDTLPRIRENFEHQHDRTY